MESDIRSGLSVRRAIGIARYLYVLGELDGFHRGGSR